MTTPGAIRVLLADDHTLVRAGIRALLEDLENVQVVAEAGNGVEAIELARTHRPDLVLMDIAMSGLNGIDAAAQIIAELNTRVLILSMHANAEFLRRAIRVGASGYLPKDAAPMELQMAIEAVTRGEVFVSSRISEHLVAALLQAQSHAGVSSVESLTMRQRQILQMIAEGRTTKEIAAALDVSIKTIESHRTALMDRLNIRDLAGLVLYAVRNGLVSVDSPNQGFP